MTMRCTFSFTVEGENRKVELPFPGETPQLGDFVVMDARAYEVVRRIWGANTTELLIRLRERADLAEGKG